MHICKTKHCHKIFNDGRVKGLCEEILEIAVRYRAGICEMGFDHDHMHITIDAGPNHLSSVAKALKGKLQ